MRRLLRVLGDEGGVALVFAIVAMAALAGSVTTIMYFTQETGHQASFGKATETAYHCAESGLNQALAVVSYTAKNNPTDPTILPGDAADGVAYACSGGGSGVYWGEYDDTNVLWTLHARASMPNPTSPTAAPEVREVSAQVTVSTPTESYNFVDNAWNYLFSTSAPSTGCDQTYTVSISAPIYVNGNACFSGGGTFPATSRTDYYWVHGWTWTASSGNKVGTSTTSRIENFSSPGGCKAGGTAPPGTPSTQHAPCVSGSDNVFFSSQGSATLTPPDVNWDSWYTYATPGPLANCVATKSSSPSSQWPRFESTGSAVRDDSLAASGAVDLTPGYSYSCKTGRGELSWDSVNRRLTVHGTVFIDGDAKIAPAAATSITYFGWGTVYIEGTLYMANVTMNPQVIPFFNIALGLVVFATDGANGACAGGQGGLVPAGDGTKLANSAYGGWLFSECNIETDANTVVKGPLIGRQLLLGRAVDGGNWWNWYAEPSGTPGNQPAVTAGTPTNFTG